MDGANFVGVMLMARLAGRRPIAHGRRSFVYGAAARCCAASINGTTFVDAIEGFHLNRAVPVDFGNDRTVHRLLSLTPVSCHS